MTFPIAIIVTMQKVVAILWWQFFTIQQLLNDFIQQMLIQPTFAG